MGESVENENGETGKREGVKNKWDVCGDSGASAR